MNHDDEPPVLRRRARGLAGLVAGAAGAAPAGTPRILVRVVDRGAMPTSTPAVFAAQQVVADSVEMEGGGASVAPVGGDLFIYVVGPGVPAAGAILAARSIDARWCAWYPRPGTSTRGTTACAFVTGCGGAPLSYATACLWRVPVGTPPGGAGTSVVACCVTGPDGTCCVAVPPPVTAGDSYAWTASHPHYHDGNAVVHDLADFVPSPLVPRDVTQVALAQSEFPVTFPVTGCGCGLPGATVRARDAGGTAVASGRTDDSGHVTLYLPAALMGTAWTWEASHPDYTNFPGNPAGTPKTGTVSDGSYRALFDAHGAFIGRGCDWAGNQINLVAAAEHYCFGGPRPPGITSLLPVALDVTLSLWPGFGTLAGATVTCNLVTTGLFATNQETARWQSTCIAMTTPYSVFAVAAKVSVSLGMDTCGPTTGAATIALYGAPDCNLGSFLRDFSGNSSAPGRIYDPVAFESDGTYNNGGVIEHYSFTVIE